ncbi:hypothetical protein AgCh_017030 [Apium graveolens]
MDGLRRQDNKILGKWDEGSDLQEWEVYGVPDEGFKDNLRGFTRRKNEVGERKMLGPELVQRTKDIVDLIRGRLIVTPGWTKELVGKVLRWPTTLVHKSRPNKQDQACRRLPKASYQLNTSQGSVQDIKLTDQSVTFPYLARSCRKLRIGYRTHSKLKSTLERSGKFSTRYTIVVM